MTPAPGSSRAWLAAGLTLVVAGSAGLLGGNAWWLAVGSRPAWYSIPGLVLGALGIAAALGVQSRPEQVAPVTAAGLLAVAVRQRGRPLLAVIAPAASAALAAGLLYVGGTFLGWTP
jgi:hypothetical protein